MAAATVPHLQGKDSLQYNPNGGRHEIRPEDLTIIWGKDNRYWKLPQDKIPHAELNQVSWLEVTACIGNTSPKKDYEVGFHISLTRDAFGWGGSPVYLLVKRGKSGNFTGAKFNLDGSDKKGEWDIKVPIKPSETSQNSDDKKSSATSQNSDDKKSSGTSQNSDDKNVYFGLYEVWSGKWKGGLKIHHAFIQESS